MNAEFSMSYGQNGQEELKESDAASQMLKALPHSLWLALDPLKAQPPSTALVHDHQSMSPAGPEKAEWLCPTSH